MWNLRRDTLGSYNGWWPIIFARYEIFTSSDPSSFPPGITNLSQSDQFTDGHMVIPRYPNSAFIDAGIWKNSFISFGVIILAKHEINLLMITILS